MNHADMVLAASYDFRLVALSYLVAVIASYTALDLAGRVTAARGRSRVVWLTSGAFAMGIGIWSMHFTGMLAFGLQRKLRIAFRLYWHRLYPPLQPLVWHSLWSVACPLPAPSSFERGRGHGDGHCGPCITAA